MASPENTRVGTDINSAPTVVSANSCQLRSKNPIPTGHYDLVQGSSRQHVPLAIPDTAAHSVSSADQLRLSRRHSSDQSNGTEHSDLNELQQWFERSNQNPKDVLKTNTIDTDPPFFPKETDFIDHETRNAILQQSSPYRHFQNRVPPFHSTLAIDNSVDDYRSIIDDLTLENKRLKEELRRLKQMEPDYLRKDKLFEVKVHGLPSAKKRELEAALRDFATNLTASSVESKKISAKSKGEHSSSPKHALSSAESHSKPSDSVYVSMCMGTGESVSSHPPTRQARVAQLRSNQNIEGNHLRDVPAGLWPGQSVMTENAKKKLIVTRLEQLFTGNMEKRQTSEPASAPQTEPTAKDIEMRNTSSQVIAVKAKEAAREAKIKTRQTQQEISGSHTTTDASLSNIHTGTQSQTHSVPRLDAAVTNCLENNGDKGNGSDNSLGGVGGGDNGGRDSIGVARDDTEAAPLDNLQPSEQRPTRPHDLDPDRRQVPAENLEYIRHLGIAVPESQRHFSSTDVSLDAEGWVYLNLLGNLAQLHMLNVTSDFIRSAVSEKSAKFQLSPDGRKIRWRGGDEDTRFPTDSDSKPRDCLSEDTDGSNGNGQRKKHKGSQINSGALDSDSSHSFHYKPLFVHHKSPFSDDSASMEDDSGLLNTHSEESYLWTKSGVSTALSKRKRRRDGAIIYYSEAPFYTDLSGDDGEIRPDTYDTMSSGDQPMQNPVHVDLVHSNRSVSGPLKSLSEFEQYHNTMDVKSVSEVGISAGEVEDDIEAHFPWSDSDQSTRLNDLEASGLGGVSPDDHFLVVVSTRRPRCARINDNEFGGSESLAQDVIVSRLTSTSPAAGYTAKRRALAVEIEHIADEFRRLPPVSLPPAAFYFRSGDSDSDDFDDGGEDYDDDNDVSWDQVGHY
ncbi:frequency clock protein [Xylaria sp. CBS 124048]|nr:frequency clock protein [Xylaria sp. CBS 124048]